jgi:hypothetical protein
MSPVVVTAENGYMSFTNPRQIIQKSLETGRTTWQRFEKPKRKERNIYSHFKPEPEDSCRPKNNSN